MTGDKTNHLAARRRARAALDAGGSIGATEARQAADALIEYLCSCEPDAAAVNRYQAAWLRWALKTVLSIRADIMYPVYEDDAEVLERSRALREKRARKKKRQSPRK